jgi:hypothetical protein
MRPTQGYDTMTNQQRQAVIEQARELIRSVWTDDLDQDTQREIQRIYDDLQYVFED